MYSKRITIISSLVIALAGVPAAAQANHGKAGDDHGKAGQEHGKAGADNGQPAKKVHAPNCTPQQVAYVARGTYESSALTKNADGTYDGTLVVEVTKTNRHGRAHQGTTQTYTLDNANVRFAGSDRDSNGTVDQADAKAGDRVKVIGKITRLHRGCDSTGFTPTVTVRKATIKDAKAPKPATSKHHD